MSDIFSRTELLLGRQAMQVLAESRVAVFGLGGVGSYAVEALARSGIGALDLIDSDSYALSNLNRQLFATLDTVGQAKADAAAARIARINPACTVRTHKIFYLPETAAQFDFGQYDYIVDAIDTVTAKLELVKNAAACHTPIISAMGTGNKLDAARLEVADISKTSVCPLARVMRRELKRCGILHLKVVYSREQPLAYAEGETPEEDQTGRRSVPGSTAFVPAAAGLILAGEVVKDLIAMGRGGANGAQ